MNQKIIFAPGFNEAEILKSLALHGINTFGMRIMNAAELASFALVRSGIHVPEKMLSPQEELVIIADAARSEKYFEKSSYADISDLRAAVRSLRSLVTEDDEIKTVETKLSQGFFKEKNEALISLFRKYITELKDQNLADGISLVRCAIENKCTLEQEIVCFAEFPLTPLEEKLAETVSGGNCRKMSISVLYLEDRTMPEKVTVRNCYGATNEVETIIDDIYRGKSLDQCTVAVTDTSAYSQLFFDYAVRHDIPVTFGCGIPVSNSNPAALLKLYNNWTTKEFFGAEALAKMLSDSSFDRSAFKDEFPVTENYRWDDLVETLGTLRMTNDRIQNDERVKAFIQAVNEEEKELGPRYEKTVNRKSVLIPLIKVAARELALAPEEFLRKYSRIRKGNATYTESLVMTLDRSALSSLCEQIRTVRSASQNVSDVINDLLGMNVCCQSSAGGTVHITDIKGAFQNLRKNLYIAGMAASKYPGSPTENYLILDSDYELFGEAASRMTSDEKIKRKTETFNDLILFAGGLDCNVTVSYPGMNVSELKKDNASSVIYDLLRKIHGSSISWDDMNTKIEKTGYFDPAVSSVREIGKAYNEGKHISSDKYKDRVSEIAETNNLLEREYSPSALLAFFECRKKFMLAHVLGIEEPEEYKNFEAVSAKDRGTIAHQLMERLADEPDMPLAKFTGLEEE